MAARHGTRRRYNEGCRCAGCTSANAAYQQRYRRRPAAVTETATESVQPPAGPGPVEAGVWSELAGLAEARPGLAQAALAMARLLDNNRALSSQPAAAKVLASLLDKLRSSSAPGRRGNLAVVRDMTTRGTVSG